ncbi:MAG: hypothetical protein AAF915_30785 [Cyanobacteria bacterium P01_D01_bin.50]
MSKNAQIRQQLNIRFTGGDKAELLQNLDAYLEKYKITKADFIAHCIQYGIDNDLGAISPVVDSPYASQVLQKAIEKAIAPIEKQLQEFNERLEKVEAQEDSKKNLTPLAQYPLPDSQPLTGEERHQLIAYRKEIKELKQSLESSHVRQKEAEEIALRYQKDIAEFRKQGKENGEKEIEPNAITLLQDALKIKNPTIRKLKSAIRQFLAASKVSKDSQMASTRVADEWENRATNFLDDLGME